jgi:hypothetical protein
MIFDIILTEASGVENTQGRITMTKTKGKQGGLPDWLWLLLIVLPILYVLRHLIWWLLCPSYERLSSHEIDTKRRALDPDSRRVDDLTVIKGIGPKLAQALQDGGIWSFTQLALVSDQQLAEALQRADARISNSQTWKKQAELAAHGAWDELEEYQGTL